MKILILLLCLPVFSKEMPKDFNQALLNDLNNEVKKDEDQFRKLQPMRGPASVIETSAKPVPVEENKVDKTVRQTGARDW